MNRDKLFFISLIGFMIYILVEINYIRKTQDMILRSNTKMLEMMINDFDKKYGSDFLRLAFSGKKKNIVNGIKKLVNWFENY